MATQQAVDEAAIRRHIDKLVEGIRTGDLEGLRPLFTTDMVSFDVEPPLQHVGVDAKMKNWAGVFTVYQTPISYEVRDLTVTVGDDVAFVHSLNRLSGTLKNGTATSGFWVRYTSGLRKIDGHWLIAHDQVSPPFDFETGRAVLDLEL